MRHGQPTIPLIDSKTNGVGDDRVILTPKFKRRLSRMFFYLVAVPTFGTIGAVIWAFYRPIGYTEVGLLGIMWFVTSFGVEVGFHRFLVHRSFDAPAAIRFILVCAGAMAFQGPPVYWAALHRRHHENSDGPSDPHTPHPKGYGLLGCLRGLWHGHAGWVGNHEVPNTLHYVPDLLKDPVVTWVNRNYLAIALAGLLTPAAIVGFVWQSWEAAGIGFLWGGLVRVFVVTNLIWSVNSICHSFGSQEYKTNDDSRNVAFLALVTFGGSWHNNHHAFPTSARAGLRWWQFDLAYLMIWLMARLRLVSGVRLGNSLRIAHLRKPEPPRGHGDA